MNWKHLSSTQEVDELVNTISHQQTCIIFKHSTTCSISSIAKYRLQDDWNSSLENAAFYYLDLLRFREVSSYIADKLNVHHESPQIIIIKNGESTYDVSHMDIEVSDILTEI